MSSEFHGIICITMSQLRPGTMPRATHTSSETHYDGFQASSGSKIRASQRSFQPVALYFALAKTHPLNKSSQLEGSICTEQFLIIEIKIWRSCRISSSPKILFHVCNSVIFLSKLTELRNHRHNPIFEHYHLHNKTPRVCLQLISIPTSSPRLSACNVSAPPSLNSHALGLAASIHCVQWLPRKGQCLCHRLSCAGWTQMHTQTHTYTHPKDDNVPRPAHRGEVQNCHPMLPIQLLQVWLRFSKAAGKLSIILHHRYHF